MISGELAKLKITAYTSPTFDASDKVGEGEFLVQVNPESYTVNYLISYREKEIPAGRTGYDSPWNNNQPRTMSFEFLFDGTGAIPSYGAGVKSSTPFNSTVENLESEITSRVSVSAQIANFERTVFNIRSDTHVPNYLLISWGSLIFKCRMRELSITHKLFSPEGLPLRALADATFVEVKPKEDEAKNDNKESPDITHFHQIREGDTLPLMAKRIYGDERYYMAVAQANNLIQFRNLSAGQELYFPPIESSQSTPGKS